MMLLLSTLLLPSAALAKVDPLPARIGSFKRAAPPRTIRGVKLFDYMNGAAEVHRMYGFRSLVVGRYADKGKRAIKVERFEMASAEGAFADFTHARDLEGQPVKVGQDGHYQSGVLWYWQGRYLVCVGSRAANVGLAQLKRLGLAIAARLPKGRRPDLVGKLPAEGLRARTVRYFRVTAALKYHYGDFAHAARLGLSPKTTEATLADYKVKAGQSVLLVVRYTKPALASAAVRRLVATGLTPGVRRRGKRWTALRREGRVLRLVLEAPSRAEASRLLIP